MTYFNARALTVLNTVETISRSIIQLKSFAQLNIVCVQLCDRKSTKTLAYLKKVKDLMLWLRFWCVCSKFVINSSGSVVTSWSTYSTALITEEEVQTAIDANIVDECMLQNSGLKLREKPFK